MKRQDVTSDVQTLSPADAPALRLFDGSLTFRTKANNKTAEKSSYFFRDKPIPQEPEHSIRNELERILERPLIDACDRIGYPTSNRLAFVNGVIDSFLELGTSLDERGFADRIREERAHREQLKLPDRAEKIWKHDRLISDTPPDFIKRHYQKWLRADATGLTRAHIHKLDPSLYNALANWLKSGRNTLPEDCPLPRAVDVVEAKLDRFKPDSWKEIEQLARAQRYRQLRAGSK